MRLLVTGGCGFIGSNFVRYVLQHYGPEMVTNVDALTTGRLTNLAGVAEEYGERYEFLCADLGDAGKMEAVLSKHHYFAVVHFAAEGCGADVTESLLGRARRHGVRRFLLVSREGADAALAAVEDRALAAHRQHGQEVVITRATETYGPFQSPPAFIPNLISHALRNLPAPLEGDGSAVRDWLHVEDHCAALFAALLDGEPGAIYRIASGQMIRDADLAHRVLEQLGRDRELEDWRGAAAGSALPDGAGAASEVEPLAWKPRHGLDAGLRETVDWYVRQRTWLESLAGR